MIRYLDLSKSYNFTFKIGNEILDSEILNQDLATPLGEFSPEAPNSRDHGVSRAPFSPSLASRCNTDRESTPDIVLVAVQCLPEWTTRLATGAIGVGGQGTVGVAPVAVLGEDLVVGLAERPLPVGAAVAGVADVVEADLADLVLVDVLDAEVAVAVSEALVDDHDAPVVLDAALASVGGDGDGGRDLGLALVAAVVVASRERG